MTINWRNRQLWLRIGYILTFAWIIAVYEITNGHSGHPLSRYMFIVPLGGWILGLVIARLVLGKRRGAPR
ncbi:MAG: hypothetical protein U1F33_13280 [Alphaproteobacteria bacterium]